jgi:hypothetical protein
MKSIALAVALSALAIPSLAIPAMADTGVPSYYFAGGGCFNFVMNNTQYSIPNAGVGGIVPRGGQATIDDWKALIRTAPLGTVSFQRLDPVGPDVCSLNGFGVKGVSSP